MLDLSYIILNFATFSPKIFIQSVKKQSDFVEMVDKCRDSLWTT